MTVGRRLFWSKFVWEDWENDEAVKMCSAGAQALWMRMLCLAARGGGYVTISDQNVGPRELSQLLGWSLSDVTIWFAELEKWRVFSRDVRGRVTSRRMVRDLKRMRPTPEISPEKPRQSKVRKPRKVKANSDLLSRESLRVSESTEVGVLTYDSLIGSELSDRPSNQSENIVHFPARSPRLGSVTNAAVAVEEEYDGSLD